MGIRKELQNRPRLLEQAFRFQYWAFMRIRGLLAWIGFDRVDRWIHVPEEFSKKLLFDCRMCGQCVLHSTGMTCPMTCPKNLRNGPCGGVRADGGCEVKPEMRCIWVEAFERSQKMTVYGEEFKMIQPPLNRQLEGSSSWITLLAGRTEPPAGWISPKTPREE
jgi:hypothetical protein